MLRIQLPDRDTQVQVTPDSIVGADIRLVQGDETVRGRAFGRSVYLQVGEERVEGAIGAQPMWLSWWQEEGTLRLEGTLIGSPVGLEVSPERLTGSAGPCFYQLQLQDEVYAGVRICGTGDIQRVSVSLPSSVLEWDSPMRFTALALLLGM